MIYFVYMDTAVINIKIEPRVKRQAQKVAEELGLSLSAVLKGCLNQLIQTKEIIFRVSEQPSDYLLKALEESKKDIKAGRVVSFNKPEEAISYVDKLIEDDKKRRKNWLFKKVRQTTQEITCQYQNRFSWSAKNILWKPTPPFAK